MSDCIFCKIIAGSIPAATVYADDAVMAFLDIHPVHPGHTLVIPRQHYPMMIDTPDAVTAHVFICAKQLMSAIKMATKCDYVAVSVVGIDVAHFHVHLIPRYLTDNFTSWPTGEYQQGEMQRIADQIRQSIVM